MKPLIFDTIGRITKVYARADRPALATIICQLDAPKAVALLIPLLPEHVTTHQSQHARFYDYEDHAREVVTRYLQRVSRAQAKARAQAAQGAEPATS